MVGVGQPGGPSGGGQVIPPAASPATSGSVSSAHHPTTEDLNMKIASVKKVWEMDQQTTLRPAMDQTFSQGFQPGRCHCQRIFCSFYDIFSFFAHLEEGKNWRITPLPPWGWERNHRQTPIHISKNGQMTSKLMVHKKIKHFLVQFFMAFHVVSSFLLRVLASKTTLWMAGIFNRLLTTANQVLLLCGFWR